MVGWLSPVIWVGWALGALLLVLAGMLAKVVLAFTMVGVFIAALVW